MFIIKYLLWLQTGYAIWQFFRYTKFVRMPYVIASSLWNSGFSKSWFQRRKLMWISGEGEFNTPRKTIVPQASKIEALYGYYRYDDCTFFKLGKQGYTFYIESQVSTELERLLSHLDEYVIAHKLLPVYNEVFVLKCIPLKKAIDLILAGSTVSMKEEVCLLDETTEDFLNENFLRIMSILPLTLQAKGFDNLSTYLSCVLLVMDVLSVPINAMWQRFCDLFIRYTKLTLSHLHRRVRVPIHYILSTGSQEFMFTDKYREKSYWSPPRDFLIKIGSCTNGWTLKNRIDHASRVQLTNDNMKGWFSVGGQKVDYTIFESQELLFPQHKYKVSFGTTGQTSTMLSLDTVEMILYKIALVNNLPLPPVEKVQGSTVYFSNLEAFLHEFSWITYNLYTSPQQKIFCS